MPVLLAEVRDAPVDPGELVGLVSRREAGAIAVFLGVVRDHDAQAEGPVVALEYTCHPSAHQRIGEIAADVLGRWDPHGECAVAAVHRIGHLVVGDNAFLVAVSAPHRQLAFTVCERLVDEVKARLPIWKQQFEADGSYRWSNL